MKLHLLTQNYQFRRILPLLSLLFLSIIYFIPVILGGKTFFAFDCLFDYLPWSYFNNGYQSNNILITDPINGFLPPHFYPSHHYFKQSLGSGEISFWFNQNFCGVPFIFYSYPLSYLFFMFLPITTAHDLLLFVHLFGSGLFTYFYLTKIGLNRISSTVGAISWMFNGYVMVWFEFEHVPMLAMTLSASLLFIELWFEKRTVLRFMGLVFALSLSLSTSYAHLLVYQMIFIGIYILFRYILGISNTSSAPGQNKKIVAGLILATVSSIIISTNFFVSNIILYKTGHRVPFPYNRLFKETGQLPPKYLSTMIFPNLFGSPSAKISPKLRSFTPKTDKRQKYNNYNELCIYAGILTLFMALSAFPYFRENSYIRFYIFSLIVCLLIAMGSILYYPFAVFIPGLNLSTPTRILYLYGFSLSILAAFGAQILQKARIEKRNYIILMWATIIIILAILVGYIQTDSGIKWAIDSYYLRKWQHIDNLDSVLKEYFGMSSFIIVKPMLLVITSCIILGSTLYAEKKYHKKLLLVFAIILLSYDLLSFGKIYNTVSPKIMEFPTTPAIKYLKKDKEKFRIMTFGQFLPHGFTPFNLEDIGGYGSFYSKRYGEYLYKSQHGPDADLPKRLGRWIIFRTFGSPLIDLLNTKYVLTPSKAQLKTSALELIYDKEIRIYKNKLAFPRVFFVPKYELAKNAKDAYMKIGRFTHEDFRNTVILELEPSQRKKAILNNNIHKTNILSDIKILSYTNDKIKLAVASNCNGYLVISENYHPDWVAHIDGNKTEVLKANYIMRAIPVDSGTHIVELEFRPKILITGFLTTIIGWIILISIILIYISREIYSKYIYHKISHNKR